MKKIAIIVPMYNSEKTIENTVNSILNQKFEDYELILIDDHSQDKTAEICKNIEALNEGKVKYFLNPKKGVSSARSYGLEVSNSEYIMFLDSDDEYVEGMLETMYSNINNADYDLVICSYNRIIEKTGNIVNPKMQAKEVKEKQGLKEFLEELQKECLLNQIWNKIFKSSIIKENGIVFKEGWSTGEDYRLVLEYMNYVNNVKYIREHLYNYYSNDRGLNFKFSEDKIYIKLDNILYLKVMYEKNSWDIQYVNKMYIVSIISYFSDLYSNLEKNRRIEVLKKFISDKSISEQLSQIYKQIRAVKYKLLIKMISCKNALILDFFTACLCIAKKLYRKVKFR